VNNYEQVNSLPGFRLFTVFFLVSGLLLILLATIGLYADRLTSTNVFHHHTRPTHA